MFSRFFRVGSKAFFIRREMQQKESLCIKFWPEKRKKGRKKEIFQKIGKKRGEK
jgi:hypothetical protein